MTPRQLTVDQRDLEPRQLALRVGDEDQPQPRLPLRAVGQQGFLDYVHFVPFSCMASDRQPAFYPFGCQLRPPSWLWIPWVSAFVLTLRPAICSAWMSAVLTASDPFCINRLKMQTSVIRPRCACSSPRKVMAPCGPTLSLILRLAISRSMSVSAFLTSARRCSSVCCGSRCEKQGIFRSHHHVQRAAATTARRGVGARSVDVEELGARAADQPHRVALHLGGDLVTRLDDAGASRPRGADHQVERVAGLAVEHLVVVDRLVHDVADLLAIQLGQPLCGLVEELLDVGEDRLGGRDVVLLDLGADRKSTR